MYRHYMSKVKFNVILFFKEACQIFEAQFGRVETGHDEWY